MQHCNDNPRLSHTQTTIINNMSLQRFCAGKTRDVGRHFFITSMPLSFVITDAADRLSYSEF